MCYVNVTKLNVLILLLNLINKRLSFPHNNNLLNRKKNSVQVFFISVTCDLLIT